MAIIYSENQKIRNDKAGAGFFHSRRTKGDVVYQHRGIDVECIPNDRFLSPISGRISRIVQVYFDAQEYKGIIIENQDIRLKILYVDCIRFQGKDLTQGQDIGFYQDISKRYPDAHPHCHVEVMWINPLILM